MQFRFIIKLYFTFLALCLAVNCFSQVNFKAKYLESDPVQKSQSLNNEEKIKIHEVYLEEAKVQNDTLKQIYGLFHLFADHFRTSDYVALKKLVLDAKKLIDHNSKPEWRGALIMRTAYILELVNKDKKGAIAEYKDALKYCRMAKDSLCISESLEQLSNINKNLGNYALAESYFKEAIILMKKFASPEGVSMAYNNYSLLAAEQSKHMIAENYIDSAISIASELKDTFDLALYISNKASILQNAGRFNEAIQLFEEAVPINIHNKWPDNLLYNYDGLGNCHEELGQYKKSNFYLEKYHELNDSLNGAQMQEKIIKLELREELNSKDILLVEAENQLVKSNYQRGRLIAIMIILLLASALLFYAWCQARRSTKKEQLSNIDYIEDLRKILSAKNSEIRILNEKNISLSSAPPIQNLEDSDQSDNGQSGSRDPDFKIFDARIINDEGITAFNSYFNKIYPGLLFRVRKMWPTISQGEERLFMLVKLRIKTNEAAEILGISSSSVKKSRNRLRKRLELEPTVDLEDFVQEVR